MASSGAASKTKSATDKKAVALPFCSFGITPETPDTAVLLLSSKEPELICNTLRAITKYLLQDMSNRYELFSLNAIHHILPLIEHPEINIRRFALKALALLCQLEEGPAQVLEDPNNVKILCNLLTKMEDIFVLEFSSLVLAELTKYPEGCSQLINSLALVVLFNRMRNSIDPDVQKNSLQILLNCVEDKECVEEVSKSPQFQWPALLALITSKFLAIQHTTLRTIDLLLQRYDDANIQKSFKASNGIRVLCEVLESYEFRDIHTLVLGVIKTFVCLGEDAVAHVFQSGCLQNLQMYLEVAPPGMKPVALHVLVQMTFTMVGRGALYANDLDLVFCQYLASHRIDVLADAAMGIANMCQVMRSAMRMTDTNIMEPISEILTDDGAVWFPIRMNTLLAMSVLVRIIEKAAKATVEPDAFAALRSLVSRRAKDTPIEGQRLVCQVYINLLNYQVSTKAMLNLEFIGELLEVLKRPDIQLKILAAKVLSGLCADEYGKGYFSENNGELVIHDNLSIQHVGLVKALSELMTVSVTESSADVYVDIGTLHFMLENTDARYKIPEWEMAIESILCNHPSAKLAYTGKLEINDFTTDGFYVMKRLGCPFPSLRQILDHSFLNSDPVLISVVNGNPIYTHNLSMLGIRTPYTCPSKADINDEDNDNVTDACIDTTSHIPDDPNLQRYILSLRLWFGDPTKSLHYIQMDESFEVRSREKCSEVPSTLKKRAQLLGEFVAEEMSGLNQERDCTLPSVEMHLNDIMMEKGSPVVSLGSVKCGGFLERAMLYKVLADRLGLPCSLNRSTNAYAWVEVAVPEVDLDHDEEVEEKYPAGLLRANYVVDLMDTPGRLVPINSREAEWLCGPKCAPLYVALRRPACKCKDIIDLSPTISSVSRGFFP